MASHADDGGDDEGERCRGHRRDAGVSVRAADARAGRAAVT